MLEQEEEVELVVEIGQKIRVRPVIGMKAKLRTKHAGHFWSTSGENGKFGLTTAQVLRVAKRLETERMFGCLQLLHFHIGSQIPSTALLADGVDEATQIYYKLVRISAGMRVIDVGGGLGVNYDGSRSPNSDNSFGYNVQEYAAVIVQAICLACDRKFDDIFVISVKFGRLSFGVPGAWVDWKRREDHGSLLCRDFDVFRQNFIVSPSETAILLFYESFV
ncbi:hypothetical protein Syun_013744 [Stephania yunnanensis]|uniref:Arginine decarboxylase n=1 Tax=Stephania yunnanensis TaxID=152371 RepID=A0AAP0JI76_9MAGN